MKEKNAILLLLLTAFIWGMSFVAQSVSADSIGPFSFNSIRFFIGALVLIPFTYPIIKSHKGDGTYMEKLLKGGFFVGLCLSLATVTQQAGMFSFTGLTPEQVDRLATEFGIYAVRNGRICICGLNEKNVGYVARSFAQVL